MSTQAVILGDVRSLLKTGPVELLNPAKWTQRDSDIIAHAVQVYTQITRSRWNASEIRFTVQGDEPLDSSFPAFADFVFAAVYFRQMIADTDSLLADAVKRYKTHVACGVRRHWVQYELDSFVKTLKSKPFPIKLSSFTNRELFDAFIYGSSLMHKVPHERSAHRRRFHEVYDKYSLTQVLFALNMTLKTLLGIARNIVRPMYQDFAAWQVKHSLPPPDIRWHSKLFTTSHMNATSGGRKVR